jgi:hypothetical protein
MVPLNSTGSRVHDTLGATAGDLVTVAPDRMEGTAR